jgi:CRISPR type III-A-associated RAMP protein Csm4
MNPGLVVKLRPSGPWRIGPDSGARNRVDVIYHSDSLYSAVTSAMSRMGSLSTWLDATARSQTPAVCFSSCFPFLDDIGFVVPPRTIWPPTSPAAMSARVRWKSARFIPLNVVESMLAGKRLNENLWSVDGASGCLVPAGKPGPFRTSVRWSAAVDRLSGASERHATACIEFREGCGLWTVVGFPDEAARAQWQEPVKAAFRLLADTGFGGERSRGWGRSETPEFVEGMLPGLIIEYKHREPSPPVEEPPSEEPPIEEPPPAEEPVPDPEPPMEADGAAIAPTTFTETPKAPRTDGLEVEAEGVAPDAVAVEADVSEAAAPLPDGRGSDESAPEVAPAVVEPALSDAPIEAAVKAPDLTEPMRLAPEPEAAPSAPTTATHLQAHWLLSLFTPAAEDTVDWARGSYTVLARGGRIDSPAGSGELKKQLQMVAEGSVLYADGVPLGAAADVAPDGFAHPVFRAGFALAITLPEVH